VDELPLVRVRYCAMRCHPLVIYRLNLAPVIVLFLSISCIVPFWTVTSVCVSFLLRLVLFRYIGVIAHVFCHADVSVCLFVVTVANFWYVVIESRLSNSKLHYEFTVLYFWLLYFAWDPSTSFQSHFCCRYCFIYSFLFGIRLCRLLF